MKRIFLALAFLACASAKAQVDTNEVNKRALRFTTAAGFGVGFQLQAKLEFEYKGFFAGIGRGFQARMPIFIGNPKDIGYTKFGFGYNLRSSTNFGLITSFYFGHGEVVESSLEHDAFFFFNTKEYRYPSSTRDIELSGYYQWSWFVLSLGLSAHVNDHFTTFNIGLGLAADIGF